jgi:SAM-dependent methyltransferase
MHEILGRLEASALVLDLGCARGSFSASSTAAHILRADRDEFRGPAADRGERVRADAAALPFAGGVFAAVISTHSLEHFDDLAGALGEIRRVLNPEGALCVAVPDASTITDRLYRWLARGGGHVNAFTSESETVTLIERATGLRHIATRRLFSSLSFLNRRNAPRPLPVRLVLFGNGHEPALSLYVWLSRLLDRCFGTRLSDYGWAFYFGRCESTISTEAWRNVCIRCGNGFSAAFLAERKRVRRGFLRIRIYDCPECGAVNPFVH